MLLSGPTKYAAERDIDTVGIIVDALRTKFGDEAADVAEAQRMVSSGKSRSTWAQIVERLRV